ncbi:MAG: bifunctional acetate--CoA ligase family protein/GNAT family N-acetyltransferase [Pseudomonadota bacterium]
MSLRNLDAFFEAGHIALVGASPKQGSVGKAFAENLLHDRGKRTISLVNPHHNEILHEPCVPALSDLATTPDLAIIATPADTVPGLVAEAKLAGVRGAVVVSSCKGGDRRALRRAMQAAARGSKMRILGPDSQGIFAAANNLNASLASTPPQSGSLGLIAQSGAIMNAVLDWGSAFKVGFSKAISLGDAADVDLDDLLDYLAYDARTRAILVCVESVGNTRRFFSAARAAAKVKPVVILKSGRHSHTANIVSTHADILATEDAVYDAVIRRAGLLRVYDLDGLFDAAEALARLKRPSETGERLSIVTNDLGIGIIAADRLLDLGGKLAATNQATRERLAPFVPLHWNGHMPLDLEAALPIDDQLAVIDALIDDDQSDGLLIAYSPNRMSDGSEAAARLVELLQAKAKNTLRPKPIFVSWLEREADALATFDDAKIARFRTPGDAVRGFMDVSRYAKAQQELSATPPALPEDLASADVARARALCDTAVTEGRIWLNPIEITDILASYGFSYAAPLRARDAQSAADAAQELLAQHRAVALKIDSPDIPHKSDVGGVLLDLDQTLQVHEGFDHLMERVAERAPTARLDGVIVQPMADTSKGIELYLGLADDPVFGPVIVFGRGGIAVEAINDKALGMPPLDMRLARQVMEATRVSRLMGGFRGRPAVDQDAVAQALVRLSQLTAEVPQIRRLDLNPMLATPDSLLVLDARIEIAASTVGDLTFDTNPRMTIRPYPRNWERAISLKDGGTVFVRPIRPEDEPAFGLFFTKTTQEDLRLRFFSFVRDFSHKFIARLTQIDYARDMAFGAFDGNGELLGVVRLHTDPNREVGEYAILLRSDLKGQGLGWSLMQIVIAYGQSERFRFIEGQVLSENTTMLAMCKALGFSVKRDPDDRGIMVARLDLTQMDQQQLEGARLKQSARA